MTDTLIFSMPEQLEDFLFSIPSLQELLFGFRAENKDFKAYVIAKPELAFIARSALFDATIVSVITEEVLKQADMVVELTRSAAYAVCGASMQGTKAFGALIGSAPALTVPVIGEDFNSVHRSVLWLPRHSTDWSPNCQWPHMAEFIRIVGRDVGSFSQVRPDASPGDARTAISGADMCIGIVGGLTLMAAALGKPLVELYPPSLFNKSWAAKWEMPDYRVFFEELQSIRPDSVWESAKSLAASINGRRSKWESRHPLRKAVAV